MNNSDAEALKRMLKVSLTFMSENCPSAINLKNCEVGNDGAICKKKCVECWIDALDLDIDLVDIDNLDI